ncbi:MAG: hypothetical protein K2M79_03090 [Muribaculaceae bacterium]|nr:hypothetical protein [Muribaculaceae bacterium]
MERQLQLYLAKSMDSHRMMVAINGDPQTEKEIPDFAPAVSMVNYDATEKFIFFVISYLDHRQLFTIIRTIPDVPGHHLAATIVVPDDVEISAARLYELIRITTRKISHSGVTAGDIAELRQAFSEKFPVTDGQAAVCHAKGDTYAYRRYTLVEGQKVPHLRELLGHHLYQRDYLEFAGVILADIDLPVSIHGTDLTGRRLENDSAGRKMISPATFYITTRHDNTPLMDCLIKVNGVRVERPVAFTMSELRPAEVDIECTGCFPYRGMVDLTEVNQVHIELPERRHHYRFVLPVNDGEADTPAVFEIKTAAPLEHCPVEGYELLSDRIYEGSEGENRLRAAAAVKPRRSFKSLLWTFLTGLLIGVAVAVAVMLQPWKTMANGTEEEAPAQKTEQTDNAPAPNGGSNSLSGNRMNANN